MVQVESREGPYPSLGAQTHQDCLCLGGPRGKGVKWAEAGLPAQQAMEEEHQGENLNGGESPCQRLSGIACCISDTLFGFACYTVGDPYCYLVELTDANSMQLLSSAVHLL